MRSTDFAPLYRSTVGFDRLFSMLDGLSQPDNGQAYPPYNIERTGENAYRITMAAAASRAEPSSAGSSWPSTSRSGARA
jgi:molecular chaperone IbpA